MIKSFKDISIQIFIKLKQKYFKRNKIDFLQSLFVYANNIFYEE